MLEDLKHKIQALSEFDAELELEKVIQDNATTLVGLQRSQWAQGIDRNEESTKLDGRDYYSVFTYDYKQLNGSGLGAVTDYITGYMSGELYSNTAMFLENKEIVFKSSVTYWADLLDRTGEQWAGISETNRLGFAQAKVIPGIQQAFKEKVMS